MGSVNKARQEFLKIGYKPIEELKEDDPDRWVQENVLELLEVFAKQGHSGYSAPFVLSMFKKLASHEPLGPILCTDDEWNDVSEIGSNGDPVMYQNNRLSSVFKDGEDGKPYFLDAIVFVEGNGNSYTGSAYNTKRERITSSQTIKLPFTPKRFYIDVVSTEVAPDDWDSVIKDESQLKEVWQYYEKQETQSVIRKKKLISINNA